MQAPRVLVCIAAASCRATGSSIVLTSGTCCAGAVSAPQVSVDFDATTDTTNIYRQVSTNGLTFQFGQPPPNLNFQAAATSSPTRWRSPRPSSYASATTRMRTPAPPVTIAASAGTFTLLSLFAANNNANIGDTTQSDDVQFIGLRNGVAVPGCGPTGVTLLNSVACQPAVPCAATQVTFPGART